MAKAPIVRFLDRTTPPHIATLILLAGVSTMVMNMFLPSLPKMTEYFETDYRLMQLSVGLYLGVSAGLQLIIGPLSDNLGRRKVLLWSLALFSGATVGCIYATSAEMFLFFRMLQAVVAAAMVLSRAIIRDVFDQDQSASMIGYVTMGMAVVPMLAPAVGGVLDEAFGWHSVFWVLLASGLALILLVWFDVGETARVSTKSLGAQFAEYPQLLNSLRFWAYSLAVAFSSGAFFAYLGGAPFVGDRIYGLSEAQLGLLFGAPALGYFAGNWISGRYATTFGINKLMAWGCLVNAFGTGLSLLIVLAGLDTHWTFFSLMTFVGLGNGMTIPNGTAGLLSVRPHLAGTASGLGSAIMIGGGAALSVLAGLLLTEETGAAPLLYIMFSTALLGVLCIVVIHRRESELAHKRIDQNETKI